jgi:quercetin dioxygenase-like cupin family protein
MHHRLIALAIMIISLTTTSTGQENKIPQAWNPKTIQWQSTDKDGTKWSVLQGNSEVSGEAFTYAAFIPAGYHDRHSHSSEARVAVVQGVLKLAIGNSKEMKSYPVGSFLFVPANIEHVMATDEDTIIIGTATGPWTTHHHRTD